MPFRSKAQARFLFAKHPKLAKEFAEATPSMKSLPEAIGKVAQRMRLAKKVSKKKAKKKASR